MSEIVVDYTPRTHYHVLRGPLERGVLEFEETEFFTSGCLMIATRKPNPAGFGFISSRALIHHCPTKAAAVAKAHDHLVEMRRQVEDKVAHYTRQIRLLAEWEDE